jgi:CRISPR/Cas system-associated endoribonuclease Cas2
MVCHEWNLKINKIRSFARLTSEDGFILSAFGGNGFSVNGKDFFLVPMNFCFTSIFSFGPFGVQNSIFYKKLKSAQLRNCKNTHPRYRHKLLFSLAFTMHPVSQIFLAYVFGKTKDSKILVTSPAGEKD